MELANEVLYLGFGLIFFGLSFNTYHNLKLQFPLHSQKAFWAFSVLCMSLSCFVLVLFPLFKHSLPLLSGSLLMVAAEIGLCLLFKSLNSRPKKWVVMLSLLALLPIGMGLGLIELYQGYEIQVVYLSTITITLSVWQLIELNKQYRKFASIYILFLLVAIIAQIMMWLFRIWTVTSSEYGGTQFHFFNESIPEFIAQVVVVVLYALIYIAISNFYYDQLVASEKQRRHEKEDQMLLALEKLALARDNETGNHIIRTQHYVRALAKQLRESGHYLDKLSNEAIEAMFKAAPLHDIGKVAIPDSILLKAGPLTADEWDIMKTHAAVGESVLLASAANLSVRDQVIQAAIQIAGAHHEKWDGTGYPRGLRGVAIPLEARIMALADMYDALVSQRPYKHGWAYADAIKEIVACKGTHFDPAIVDAFIAAQDEFTLIAEQFKDDIQAANEYVWQQGAVGKMT
ncbi:MAG: HD domain-containing protein [Polynucleobacter sp.]|nr:HD domain-containing protein [Polynucleobacter sp.]